ncbi:MAG: hypothetical protein OXN89_23655 [Bryobacterales bacterium]|nr:hypothetical protein [Bryobacterales bacterium]
MKTLLAVGAVFALSFLASGAEESPPLASNALLADNITEERARAFGRLAKMQGHECDYITSARRVALDWGRLEKWRIRCNDGLAYDVGSETDRWGVTTLFAEPWPPREQPPQEDSRGVLMRALVFIWEHELLWWPVIGLFVGAFFVLRMVWFRVSGLRSK